MNELDRLAATVGIESEYLTLTGEVHRVSDRAKRGVLKAMGIAADDDDAVAVSLAGLAPIALAGMRAPDGIACFVPWGIVRAGDWQALPLGLLAALGKLMIAGAGLAVLETVSAKMRIFRVPEFVATAFMLAMLGLLLHYVFEVKA